MAGGNVIRQDVVQIAFDVIDSGLVALKNELNSLTGNARSAANGVTAELDGIAKDAQTAASDVKGIGEAAQQAANGAQGMDEPIKETSASAKEAEVRLSAMVRALASNITGKIKQLPEIIRSSASAAREFASRLRSKVFDSAVSGAKKLESTVKSIAKTKVSDVFTKATTGVKNLGKSIVNNVDKGLGKAVVKAKQLPAALKTTAVSAFSKAVNAVKTRFEEAKNAAKQVGDEAKNAAKKAEGGFTILKGVIADLISNGIMRLITGVKDFAVETVKVGANFDSSMAEVAAISGATGDELQALRETAKEYGRTTVFSASESADALKYMALAGWDAEQSMDALPGILNLAAASGMELGRASDMVTDYLTAFSLSADQAAYFSDVLSYAQSNSNTTADMLGEAYRNCAANLNAAGQDMETTTALLSQMANQGLKGSEAGTALAAVMRDMTAKMENGAIKIGKTSVAVTDAEGHFRDLTDILKDVEKATDGMADGQRAAALSATFTEESLKGMNLMLNAGIGEAEEFEKALRASTGTAEKMSDTMNDNLNGDLKNLSSKLEGIRIELYEKFQPALRKGVEFLSTVLDKVGAVASKIVEWATAESTVNSLKTAFEAVKNAVSPIADAAGRVISKIYEFATSESTIEMVRSSFEKVKKAVDPIVGIIQEVVTKIANFVTSEGFILAVGAAFAGVKAVLDEIFDAASTVFSFIQDHLDIILPLVEGVAAAWLVYKAYIIATTIAAKAHAAAEWLVNAAMNANPMGLIITAIGLLIGAIILLVKNWDKVKKKAIAVWNAIKGAWGKAKQWFVDHVITPIKTAFETAWQFILTIFQAAWGAIKAVWNGVASFFQGIWEGIKAAFATVVEFFSGIFRSAWSAVTTVWNTVTGFFSGIWNGIKRVFSTTVSWFSTKFSNAWNAVKTVFDAVAGFFSGVWDDIKAPFVAAADWFGEKFEAVVEAVKAPWAGIKDFFAGIWESIKAPFSTINGKIKGMVGVESVPQMATGGVVDKPTIAEIGEKGKEAVVPLERNLGWIKSLAKHISGGNYGGNYEVAEVSTQTTYREYNEYNDYSPNFTLNMNGASATEDNAKKVKQWIKESLREVFDNLDNDNPPVWEV